VLVIIVITATVIGIIAVFVSVVVVVLVAVVLTIVSKVSIAVVIVDFGVNRRQDVIRVKTVDRDTVAWVIVTLDRRIISTSHMTRRTLIR